MGREIGIQIQKATLYIVSFVLVSWIVSGIAAWYGVTDSFAVKADTFWKALSEEGDTRVFLVAILAPGAAWGALLIVAMSTMKRKRCLSEWAWQWARRMWEDMLAISYNVLGFFIGALTFFDNNAIGQAAKAKTHVGAAGASGILIFTFGLAVVGGMMLDALHAETRP